MIFIAILKNLKIYFSFCWIINLKNFLYIKPANAENSPCYLRIYY